jgi:hypothetical protein
MAMRVRPVFARARRIAVITASVPELVNVARSIPVSSQKSAAASPEWAERGPSSNPSRNCASIVSRRKSGSWPKRWTPMPMVTSTYSLPSTSQIREPFERARASG